MKKQYTITITDHKTNETTTVDCEIFVFNAANRGEDDKLPGVRMFFSGRLPELARLNLALAAGIHRGVFGEMSVDVKKECIEE